MRVRAMLGRNLTALLTSHALCDTQRLAASMSRRLRGGAATVHYFHQADDPYSHLAAQTLERLVRRYRIELAPHLVPAPTATAVPDRARLSHWASFDAGRLGRRLGLDTASFESQPDIERLEHVQGALAAPTARQFAAEAGKIGARLWRADSGSLDGAGSLAAVGTSASATPEVAVRRLLEGETLRNKLGHYLSATFYYGGEWYWGVDRLHYLEDRLRDEGLRREPGADPVLPVLEVGSGPAGSNTGGVVDFYCSLRSPYTYLALPRVRDLAKHSGATLRLRFLLPMVMRGLPVPRAKRLYIVRDAKREADRLGMRFGRIADPVGQPAERGLAVLHRAIQEGKGEEFAHSFLQGVFADGIDAGSDAGLRRLAERAGLGGAQVNGALADSSWRPLAAANLAELLELGLWGVPSFRVDAKRAIWGQDRLWAVEEDLRDPASRSHAASTTS